MTHVLDFHKYNSPGEKIQFMTAIEPKLYKYQPTLLNLSGGTMLKIIGSMVETLPNLTSGMYRAHTTCAQPVLSVRLRAPSLLGHNSHLCLKS